MTVKLKYGTCRLLLIHEPRPALSVCVHLWNILAECSDFSLTSSRSSAVPTMTLSLSGTSSMCRPTDSRKDGRRPARILTYPDSREALVACGVCVSVCGDCSGDPVSVEVCQDQRSRNATITPPLYPPFSICPFDFSPHLSF